MEEKTESIPFNKDRPVVLLAIFNTVVAFLIVFTTLIRLRSNDFKVPVQFIVHDGSVLSSSNWFSLYSLAFFAVFTTVVAIIIGMRLHKANRLFSGGVLLIHLVVLIFGLLVTNALLSLVGKV